MPEEGRGGQRGAREVQPAPQICGDDRAGAGRGSGETPGSEVTAESLITDPIMSLLKKQ